MIPEEIKNFLSHEGGSSLIIQGNPGSGKTILALELMDAFLDCNPMYLTTRLTTDAVYRYFPRLRQRQKEINVIESRDTFWDKFFAKADSNELRVERDAFEMYGMLDDPDRTDIAEFDRVCDRVDEFLPERSLLILDSIEGLCDKYKVSEKFFVGLINRCLIEPAHTKVVIVLEKMEKTEIDYLADGVISMHQMDRNGRRMRMLSIDKLRGIAINQPNYLFTLKNGRFRSFNAFKIMYPEEYLPFEPIPNTKTHYSTGNRDLDEIFGGYQIGSYILLETGENVDNFFYTLPMLTAANIVSQGGSAVILSVSGAGPSEVKNNVFEYGLSDRLNSFRVVTEENPEEPVTEDFVVAYDKERFASNSNILDLELAKLRAEQGGDVVKIVDYEILETMLDMQALKRTILSDKKYTAANKILTIAICKHSIAPEIKKTLANISDIHIRVNKYNDTMILYGEKPTTSVYVIEPDVGRGYEDVKLTLMR
ncbi:MAG: hypothetical protein C4B59_07830 [Candidatus Methanogaster sp.]|uniref:Uncharacterized protein n=1 Tax=Candidatus Methanogaster sp. TaxID=3386292 RepID=A0AC61L2Q1_9EURY|nr:MAG: hypothetical protein C4B59_07830 [ANME-2 cluster archaeon]